MKEKLSLCIDIGGTHIVASIIDESDMTLFNGAMKHGYVNSNADRESILDEWDNVIRQVLDQCDVMVHKVCISIPGPFDYAKGICLMDGMHKYQSLLYMNVKDWFAQTYQIDSSKIYFFNDAAAFLLGEVFHYNLFEQKVVGLTLGTGLGSALYDGGVQDLNYGSASFREGISEDYISTRGLLDFAKQKFNKEFSNVKAIVEDSSSSPDLCHTVFNYLGDSLAEFISLYISLLSPDIIIIGGSISKAHALFLNKLEEQVTIPIRMASLNEFNIFCGMASLKHQIN